MPLKELTTVVLLMWLGVFVASLPSMLDEQERARIAAIRAEIDADNAAFVRRRQAEKESEGRE